MYDLDSYNATKNLWKLTIDLLNFYRSEAENRMVGREVDSLVDSLDTGYGCVCLPLSAVGLSLSLSLPDLLPPSLSHSLTPTFSLSLQPFLSPSVFIFLPHHSSVLLPSLIFPFPPSFSSLLSSSPSIFIFLPLPPSLPPFLSPSPSLHLPFPLPRTFPPLFPFPTA